MKRQAQAKPKTSIVNTHLRVGIFSAIQLLTHDQNAQLTQLANSEARGIYKNNEAFLPSFSRSRHKSILFSVYRPFPQSLRLTKERQTSERTSAFHSHRASDPCLHPTPSELRSFRRCLDPPSTPEVFVGMITLSTCTVD